jgi:hypothetical protein
MPSVEPLWLEVSAGAASGLMLLAASSMVYILREGWKYAMSLSWFIVISHPPPFEILLWATCC